LIVGTAKRWAPAAERYACPKREAGDTRACRRDGIDPPKSNGALRVKVRWLSVGTAILAGGAITLLALVVIAHRYGNQPTMPDMERAAGFGGAIAAALMLI
jgi:hypothetical protein